MRPEKPPLIRDKMVIIATVALGVLIVLVFTFSFLKNVSTMPDVALTNSTLNSTLTPTETLRPTTPSATAAASVMTPINVESIPTQTPFIVPESHYLEILANRQYFALGCEASAAVDLAGYYDIQIYQYNFQHELPISDNPDLGFVGDAKGPWGQIPPYAYGVHAAPVAELLNKYGLDVEGGKGYTLEKIREKLAAGHPVIVWVIGNMVGGVPAEYTDSQGNKTVVAAYEHVVILTGYDQDSVRYVNNGKFFDASNDIFMNSWGVLGNMAVFHR